MKQFVRIAFAQLLVCLTTGIFAQVSTSSQWAWMSGDKTANHAGVYGTKGVAASTNQPGTRAFSNSWTDASGNLWLFGGIGNAESDFGVGPLNDLWKYDPVNNQWTWVTGENVRDGTSVYGTKGVAAPTNTPGSRIGSVSWTDASGNLWLFGGVQGIFELNDLWKFNTASNQWTWVSGDNTGNNLGVYGTRGVAAPTNKPGGRQDAISWIDASGKLWLFGGNYFDALDHPLYLNDLWKYDPATDLWTWVSGDNTPNSTGSFGTKGVASPSNKPSSRIYAVSWENASGGDLWLFGGIAYASGTVNDLWKYNIASDQWTWMSGDNASNVPGVYGTMGVAAATNKPGSRRNAVTWRDASGNLWLCSGLGYAPTNGALNDVWKYDPTINEWTWTGGDNTINSLGVYGTKGVPTCSNKPAAREGAVSWTDIQGDVWIFGGTWANPSDHFNSLWELGTGAPTASTNPASAISLSGATLNGTAGDHGPVTTTTFEYGTSPTLTGATSVAATLGATLPCHTATATLTGLAPNTIYYFRVKGSNSAGTTLGSILSFTTTPGGALNFDGTNDYVEIPTSPSLEEFVNSGQLSIEYWIKPGAPNGQYRDVISRAPTDVPHSNADYLVEGDPNSLNYLHYVRIFNYTTQNVEYVSVPVTYTVNEWQHIAITAKTGGSLKVYRNGVLQGTASLANCAFVTSSCPTRLMYDARVLGFFQNGNLDEVRLWSRELTATEIANNMNCEITAGGTNLNANYHFNQGGAGGDNPGETTLLDASGNANNAALKNFALNGSTSNWVAPGGIGYEINVQGNSVDIADGDATPSVTDSTDYGNVTTGSSLAHHFAIQNSGSGSLTVSSITVTGTNAAEFVVTGAPTSVAAGSSSPFTVTFTPASTGLRTAVIHINNNDCNEGDYDFAVQGYVDPCLAFSNNRAYVNVNATGANNGTSWTNAFTKLQDALALTNSCSNINQIWVAKGTYYPDEGGGKTDNDRNATFTLKNGIAIYGGFAGTETSLSQRNLKINATILSGDIDTDNTLANNAYHVTTASSTNSTAIIDGFTITGGNASDNGGGMLNNSGSPVISNCTFSGNRAVNGGGLYNNTAAPTITNCIFSGNAASNLGGAMSNGSSSLSLTNCTISGNTAGGGGGGGIYSSLGSGTITNCIFWNNKDVNGAGSSGSSIFNFASSLTISYSLVQGQSGGTGNLDGTNAANDPLFVTAVDPYTAPTTAGDFHLQAGSPVINVGTNGGAPSTDIEGSPRLLTLADPADMGAYELSTIPHASIADKSILEGNSGTTLMKFKVTLDHASGATVKIKYATADSTATAGSDYVAAAGTVTFLPGKISKTISITINGDLTFEKNERFKVKLSNPSNALLLDSLAIGTIKNDDAAAFASASTVENSKVDNEVVSVKVMPNPNKGDFHIDLNLPANKAATTLQLYNNLGVKVWQEDLGMVSGSVSKNVYLENKLPSGVYTLMIQRNDVRYATKVVVTK